MCNKTKNKNKKYFCKYCLQCFSSEKILVEHKKSFLKINGKQNLKLKSGSIKSKNHFKQLVVPLKIYADFGCNMKELVVVIEIILHTLKNIKNTCLAVLPIKLFVLLMNLVNQLFFTVEKCSSQTN